MKTGVIYARYSAGPRQTDQSIEGQVTDCTAYAAANGIDLIGTYADRHISGKSVEGRDEFQRMMLDAEAHKFDCIIIWKIDRFGRNRQDIAVNKMRLKRAGVELHYAKESVPDGPEGIILESLLEGLAEYYSADLRQKVKRGIRESTKKGRYPGGRAPIGFALDENRHVIVDEKTAPAIRRAFKMHNDGAKMPEILEMLNRAGVVSLYNQKPVTKSVVHRILRNPKYCGQWEIGGEPFDAPGIVSEEVFMEAQKHFKTRKKNAAGTAKQKYLLSGKCTCAYCGSTIVGESARGKMGEIYTYYTCGAKKRKGKCEFKAIRQQVLEDAVIDATRKTIVYNDDIMDQIVNAIMRLQEEDARNDYLNILKNRREDARKRRENILRALEYAPDIESISDRLRAIEEELKDLNAEIMKEELEKPIISADVIREYIESFRDFGEDEESRKKIAQTFINKIELRNDEALIYYNVSDEKSSRTDHLTESAVSCSNSSVIVNLWGITLKISIKKAHPSERVRLGRKKSATM